MAIPALTQKQVQLLQTHVRPAARFAVGNHLDLIASADATLLSLDPSAHEALDRIDPFDPTVSRQELEAGLAQALAAGAEYHVGFLQACILFRIQLAAVTGRNFH